MKIIYDEKETVKRKKNADESIIATWIGAALSLGLVVGAILLGYNKGYLTEWQMPLILSVAILFSLPFLNIYCGMFSSFFSFSKKSSYTPDVLFYELTKECEDVKIKALKKEGTARREVFVLLKEKSGEVKEKKLCSLREIFSINVTEDVVDLANGFYVISLRK